MECPQCRAQNPDDSVFCSLCYHSFKAKPQAASSKLRGAAFESAVSQFEGWTVTGPVLILDDGFYFFVKECISNTQAAMRAASGQFGLVGALVGAAIESQMDDSGRPPKVTFQSCAEIAERCQGALGEAPDIPACKHFFCISKKDIQKLSFGFLTGLSLQTQHLAMTINGLDKEKATGFMVMRGYPLER